MTTLLLSLSLLMSVNSIDGTIYWLQHDEVKPELCKFILVRGRIFKQCNNRPVANYYWLCDVQDFIDQFGNHSPHTVCIVIDHNEVIRGT